MGERSNTDQTEFFGSLDRSKGRFPALVARIRDKLEYWNATYFQNGPRSYMNYLEDRGQIAPMDYDQMDETSLLLSRRVDRLTENSEAIAGELQPTRKKVIIFGTGVSLILAGVLGYTLPVDTLAENLQFLVRASGITATLGGVSIISGFSIHSVLTEQPVVSRLNLNPNPDNNSEGFSVSNRMVQALSEINLDPTQDQFPPKVA